jgi:SAM-dependent methyltransferase
VSDYRTSHLASGGTYDTELASDPFDAYMDRWEARHVRDIVAGTFGPKKVPRCLDFACGTGRITRVVAPLAEETVGVDVAPGMLAVARAKVPAATFVQADLTTEAPDLGTFDLITSFRFLGNAQQDIRVAALRSLNALQPLGGLLIVNNHRNPNGLANLVARARGSRAPLELTHARLRRLLHRSGYEIRKALPIGAWQWRGALLHGAGSKPDRDERMERWFGSSVFVPIAPDAVIAARKVRPAHVMA